MPRSAGRGELLTRRALGHVTLERQLLLRRWDLPVTAAVERLARPNARDPEPPTSACGPVSAASPTTP
jgi:hypothetical protein